MLQIEVFIQNEAGSNVKNHHDEKALIRKETSVVSRRYPFPYGIVIGTTAHDGCNVDCFVITRTELRSGDRLDCLAIGLMEQTEDGVFDHNVIPVPTAGKSRLSDDFESVLIVRHTCI
jgi:inorganic pyrophosphatase